MFPSAWVRSQCDHITITCTCIIFTHLRVVHYVTERFRFRATAPLNERTQETESKRGRASLGGGRHSATSLSRHAYYQQWVSVAFNSCTLTLTTYHLISFTSEWNSLLMFHSRTNGNLQCTQLYNHSESQFRKRMNQQYFDVTRTYLDNKVYLNLLWTTLIKMW